MNINQLSNYFLKLAKDISPEASKEDLFGEFAWPKFREGFDDIDEKPTSMENKVYKLLKLHFSNKRKGLPKHIAELLSKLVEKEKYKTVLHAPPLKTVYRGLKLNSKEKLAKFLKIKINELEDSGSINFNDSIKMTNGYSTSWSKSKKITKDFSEKGKLGYSVTLIADIKDNENKFLAGPGGLYDVEGLCMYHLEKETVGLEPIIIRKIEWEKL